MRPQTPPNTLLENDIKAMLINDMARRGLVCGSDVLINELTLNKFKRRADLVVAGKSGLHAYEIKSEADSLYRLEGQIEDYLKYFDKVTIVTHSRHTPKILETVTKNVEVWELKNTGFKIIRRGKKEKITEANRLIQLMTAKDLKKLATANKMKIQNPSRKRLEKQVRTLRVSALRKFSHECLKLKYQCTSDLLWNRYSETSTITPQDISLLSPYKFYEENKKSDTEHNGWGDFFDALKKSTDDPFLSKLNAESRNLFGKVPCEFKKLVNA